jgi:hypothetical protein
LESMAQAEGLHASPVALEGVKPSSETAEVITAIETSFPPPPSPPAAAESEDEERQLLSPIPAEASQDGDLVVDHETPVPSISDEECLQRIDSISPTDTSAPKPWNENPDTTQNRTNTVAQTEDVTISLSPPSRNPTPISPETPKAPTNSSRPRRLSHLRSRSLPSPLSEERKLTPADDSQQRHTIHDLHGNIRFSVGPGDTPSTELEVPEVPLPLIIRTMSAYCSCSPRVLSLVVAKDLPLTHRHDLYIFAALFLWPIFPLRQISATASGIPSPFPAVETRMGTPQPGDRQQTQMFLLA